MINRWFNGGSNEPSINLNEIWKRGAVESRRRCRSSEEPEIKFNTVSKTAGIEVIEIVRAKDLARHNSGG